MNEIMNDFEVNFAPFVVICEGHQSAQDINRTWREKERININSVERQVEGSGHHSRLAYTALSI